MAEDIFLPGKFTNLNDNEQIAQLNDILGQMLDRLNQIDPGSLALAWITGDVAGKVIASKGVGNSPEWDDSPLLTGATISGLTASQYVLTNGSKNLVSGANPVNAIMTGTRLNKGVDTTDDIIIDLATKGLVLKDTQGTPHYWRVTVSNAGALVISDLGTSKP